MKSAFLIIPLPGGMVAATTRVGGGIGLPGGKQEGAESLIDTAHRESKEEGWLTIHDGYSFIMNQGDIYWFGYKGVSLKLEEFKEKGRITPIEATIEEIYSSGFGNNHPTIRKWIEENCK